MTEDNLDELLERAADRVPVSPAPVAAMVTQAGRVRRRRATALSLAVTAVAAVMVVGAAAVFWPTSGASDSQPVVASPESDLAPPGMRLVGLGHAAVAVPQEWGTNETRCGVPKKDTVVIDVGAVPLCDTPRPADVDSVELSQGEPRFDFTADETFEIDGVPAQRKTTVCQPDPSNGVSVCVGAVYIPSMRAYFQAESSTSAAEVDRILDGVQIVPDLVAVPGHQVIAAALLDQGETDDRYLEALREAGLVAEVRTEKASAVDPGYILDVSPSPGTMLQPGDVVTVTVVAEPESPADEVWVGINTENADGSQAKDLDDPQIRQGAVIELSVGDRIWAFGHDTDNNIPDTLAGQLDGNSLAVVDDEYGPNYPHSWVAVAPGRTTITLTITEDGQQYVLGVVTVNVK